MALRADLPARWLAVLATAAVALGLMTGVNPTIGVSVAFAIGFALLMLSDLLTGLLVFVVISFISDVIGVGLSGVKLAGVMLVFSWLAATVTQGRARRPDFFKDHAAFVFVILAFLAWGLLSASWAESPGTALAGTGRYALDACLFPIVYAALRRPEHAIYVVIAFMLGALLSVAYGLVNIHPQLYTTGVDRLGGSAGDANTTATVLIAAIVLSPALLLFFKRSPALQVAAVGGALLALAGVFTTLSRAGFVGLGVALLAGILIGGRWRGRIAVMAVITGLLAGVYLFGFASTNAQQRIESSNTDGRATIWRVAWREVSAHPIVGVGEDNFSVTSIHYLDRPGSVSDAYTIVDKALVAHNIYLEAWADLGIVGLALLLSIIAFSLRCALRAAQRFKGRDRQMELLSRMLIVAIISILATDFFASQQYSKQLWLLLALCPTLLALSRTTTRTPTNLIRARA